MFLLSYRKWNKTTKPLKKKFFVTFVAVDFESAHRTNRRVREAARTFLHTFISSCAYHRACERVRQGEIHPWRVSSYNSQRSSAPRVGLARGLGCCSSSSPSGGPREVTLRTCLLDRETSSLRPLLLLQNQSALSFPVRMRKTSFFCRCCGNCESIRRNHYRVKRWNWALQIQPACSTRALSFDSGDGVCRRV